MIRIEVDFDAITQEEHWRRIPISTSEMAKLTGHLKPGLRVVLYAEDDLDVEAILEFDTETDRWYGVPDWFTVNYHLIALAPHSPSDKDKLLRIGVDFNTMSTDPRRRVHIPTHVWPELFDKLRQGLRVIIFEEGDIEVEAILVYDGEPNPEHHLWYALPDWSTLRDSDDGESGS